MIVSDLTHRYLVSGFVVIRAIIIGHCENKSGNFTPGTKRISGLPDFRQDNPVSRTRKLTELVTGMLLVMKNNY